MHDAVLPKSLFINKQLAKWIYEDCQIVPYNPYDNIHPAEKNVIVIKGLNKYSCNFLEEDYMYLNLGKIADISYRKLIFDYILSDIVIVIGSKGSVPSIVTHMPLVLDIKLDPHNTNTNLFYYTAEEAIAIRQTISQMKIKTITKNNILQNLKRFFVWAVDCQKITVDPLFFDFFKGFPESRKFPVNDISEEEIGLLTDAVKELSCINDTYYVAFIVYLIQINTFFRPGTICKLETDCIKESLKQKKYIVHTNSKVSHGEKEEYTITEEIKLLIDAAIDRTELLRDEVAGINSLRKKIFLYRSPYGIRCFDTQIYLDVIKIASDKVGIDNCNLKKIRSTYMTEAVGYVLRNKMSDAVLGALTKHVNFNTTNQHYLSIQLDEMLESTYGIIIGDSDEYDSNVIDRFPNEIGEEQIVENNCGRCISKDKCDVLIPVICLVCQHFRTTIEHEVFFKKNIERIDNMIKCAKTQHDADDLIVIKKINVLYLKAIYKKKEELSDNECKR